jgi:sterol desaturase/sphingolipid hydroxylase (fatty acid hydroxylase superfamily)
VVAVLTALFGAGPALAVSPGWQFAYGFLTMLAVDLAFFLYHLMMHRTRLGWAIHKVHHAAEVLTPLTVAREHFLEAPIFLGAVTVGAATVAGVFAWLMKGEVLQITVMGVAFFSFLYLLNSNFRHYHVCLRYPPWLERWLMSPGMHHSHHSRLRHHWDSNLGLFTSIWDRLYGTLYVGECFEATPWGLPPEEQARCTSLADNLLAPFRELKGMLRR